MIEEIIKIWSEEKKNYFGEVFRSGSVKLLMVLVLALIISMDMRN